MSDLLGDLELAQERFVRTRDMQRRSEAKLKSLYASMYLAIRSAEQCSVEDARQRVLADKRYIDAWQFVLKMERTHDEAREALDLARLRFDEWRTEEATRRRI